MGHSTFFNTVPCISFHPPPPSESFTTSKSYNLELDSGLWFFLFKWNIISRNPSSPGYKIGFLLGLSCMCPHPSHPQCYPWAEWWKAALMTTWRYVLYSEDDEGESAFQDTKSGELHSGVNTYDVPHRAFGSSLLFLLGFTELVFKGAIKLAEQTHLLTVLQEAGGSRGLICSTCRETNEADFLLGCWWSCAWCVK